jgi:hypothetical protein
MQTHDTDAALDLAPHHVAPTAQWAARLPHMTGAQVLSLLLRLDRTKAHAEAAKAACRAGPLANTIEAEAGRAACLWSLTWAEAMRRMGGAVFVDSPSK